MLLSRLAELVGGDIDGDSDITITGIADIRAASPGDIAFLGNMRYAPYIEQTSAAAVLVPRDYVRDTFCGGLVYCDNPSAAFALVCEAFKPSDARIEPGVHSSAIIGENCRIAPDASIGAQAVISDNAVIGAGSIILPLAFVGDGATIGRNCCLHSHTAVYAGCVLGDGVTIHASSVIGCDGYGYELIDGIHTKIPQTGIVSIGDNVEIGACVSIDRARFGRTEIGAGTKIDNQVQIAHNVKIGKNCLIVAQVGISGSTIIGDNVTMAGRSGTFGHITIGDGAIVSAVSVASKDIEPGQLVSGFPARPAEQHRRSEAVRIKLPALKQRVLELEEKVKALEAQAENNQGDGTV